MKDNTLLHTTERQLLDKWKTHSQLQRVYHLV